MDQTMPMVKITFYDCMWLKQFFNFENIIIVNINASLLNVLKIILEFSFYFFNEPSDTIYVN
jgi:hypothetical protein